MKKEHYSYVMMLGHLCADLSTFALVAIMPFLVVYKDMSYAATAGLMFMMSVCNAITQPICGALADKKNRPWLMALGVFLSGVGIAALGFTNDYWAMMTAVAISSIGMAIYHPDAGRLANFVAGKSKGKGMSNFSFGGNLSGFVGPALVVFGISNFGMKGTALMAVPTTLMAVWLLTLNKRFLELADEGQQETAQAIREGQTDDWLGFLRLSAVTVLRSAVVCGIMSFIPLFWLSVLQQSEEVSGMITSLLALAGAIATLLGGRLADHIGFKNVIRAGLVAAVPFLVIIAYTRWLWLSALMLILAALALNMAYSPSVVLGQKLVPNHIGLASGVTMGLASSFGGVVSPVLGAIGDAHGMVVVIWIIVGICVLTALTSLILPNDPDRIVVKRKISAQK